MTYRTPCRAIGHFDFLLSPCYLQDTMPCQWSSSDFTASATDFERAFFTLRRFLPCTPSCWFQGVPWDGSLTLKLVGFHIDIFET